MKNISTCAAGKIQMIVMVLSLYICFPAYSQNQVKPGSGADSRPATVPGLVAKPAPTDPGKVYSAVEVKPVFPGGDEAMAQFLRDSLRYPEQAGKNGIQGIVFVAFIVGKDGKIGDVTVLKEVGGGCDEEAVRLVRSMPAWTPGRHKGLPVRVRITLPVKFTL